MCQDLQSHKYNYHWFENIISSYFPLISNCYSTSTIPPPIKISIIVTSCGIWPVGAINTRRKRSVYICSTSIITDNTCKASSDTCICTIFIISFYIKINISTRPLTCKIIISVPSYKIWCVKITVCIIT
jgi:hypothetical protein